MMRLYRALVLLSFLTFWATVCAALMAGPIVEFAKTTYDFGKPLEGEKTKAVFQFKNTGDTDLEITNVHAGCGCTQAKATETKVAPSKSAAIEAVFNTAGYKGRVSKSVTVTTNDSAHSTVVLTITGEVILIAKLTPPTFIIGELKPGASAETEVVIKPELGQKFKILRVDGGSKMLSVPKFDASPGADGTYRMKIKVTAGNAPGRIQEQLNIVTDLPGNSAIRFTAYGNVVSPTGDETSEEQLQPSAPASTPSGGPIIKFEKTSFDFGKITAGHKGKATFAFKNIGDKPLDISKINAVCACTKVVKASILAVPPGKSGNIEILFDSSGMKGNVVKRVSVRTNDPTHERNLLTVLADVQPIAKLTPESVNFATLKPDGEYETTVTLTPMTPKPFKIVKTEPGQYARITSFKPIKDGKGSYTLSLIVSAGKTADRVMDELKIVTDLPGQPSITLLVYGNIEEEEAPQNAAGS